jgi:nitroimidazol reductase NimA-like FMN-containing flavoprotein (pyridoxamine 5'-phosphate oxidase superfamily)
MAKFTQVRGYIPWNLIDIWLQSFRSIWISTTRPDGRPHSVPVWYWWNGVCLYFTSGPKGQKVKNLASQPAIVVHAGSGDDALIIEGVTSLVTDPDERARVNQAYMQKYIDPHSGAKATILDVDHLYRVDIHRLMIWEYGTVSSRTDWVRQE